MIGRWEKDITAGGCHLNELEKEASQVKLFLNLENMVFESKIPSYIQRCRRNYVAIRSKNNADDSRKKLEKVKS